MKRSDTDKNTDNLLPVTGLLGPGNREQPYSIIAKSRRKQGVRVP
jgi:hypothetical protein